MEVVYATDLSEPTEAAVKSQTCLDCLKRVGVDKIHLIHVINVSMRSGIAPFDLESPKQELLDGQKGVLEDEGFEVESHVVRGTPYRRINDLAKEVDADMIIVGSKGRGRIQRTLIGSTAKNMARTASRPLLIQRITGHEEGEVKVAEKAIFSRVLHPTDFSENAQRAYNEFQDIQESVQEVDLLHVLTGEEDVVGGEEGAKQTLEDLRGELEDLKDDIDVETNVREGNAVEEILAEEDDWDPSLVLMGSRGLSRIRRLLLGSVTESVAEKSTSNVLIVPPSGAKTTPKTE
ncbi:universal stress protein [Halorutilales archaeon Cl-col2-1]